MQKSEKKVLVTGLAGMIGKRFAELSGGKFSLVGLDISQGIDITREDMVEAVLKANPSDVLIHLAAYTDVSGAQTQKGDKEGLCYRINVEGTKVIADACARHGLHLVHISTDYVFDGEKFDPYTEEDAPHPIEWYGQTKLWAEEVVKERLPVSQWTILRLAFPYQAVPVRPDFLAKIRERLADDSLPPAFADHVLTPTFVDDIALVFERLVTKPITGVFHCVGSSWHSDYEIAQMVKQTFGLKGQVKPGSLEAYLKTVDRPYQKTMKVSNRKLTRELGVTMKRFSEGLGIIKDLR